MSYSKRFLERLPSQPEDSIAEPKLMDDEDDEAAAVAARRHRRGSSRSAHREGRAHSHASRQGSGEVRAGSVSSAVRSPQPQPPPFEVLSSPHRRPPETTPPPHAAESRKAFVSPHDAEVHTPRPASVPSAAATTAGVHGAAATERDLFQGDGTTAVDAAAYKRVLEERNTALRLLDKFKTEGNKVIRHLHEALAAQQRENVALTASLASMQQHHPTTSQSSGSAAVSRPHDAPGATLRVIELEEKIMAQERVIHELDRLMRSADTMLLAMRARCEAAEHRCSRLEAEEKRRARQDSVASAAATTTVPPLDLATVHANNNPGGSAHSTPGASTPGTASPAVATPSSGLPGELLANRLREKHAGDADVEAAVAQWMAAQAHIHALRNAIEEERRLRLSAEEAYQRTAAESHRSIQLLERRLQRAQTPRGMAYHGFDADLLQMPIALPSAPPPAQPAVAGSREGRTVITVTAAAAAPPVESAGETRDDGSRTPPSPLLRQGGGVGDTRSTRSTPTKMLFTLGSETVETRTREAGDSSRAHRASARAEGAVGAPAATSSLASGPLSEASLTIPIDEATATVVDEDGNTDTAGGKAASGTRSTEGKRRKRRGSGVAGHTEAIAAAEAAVQPLIAPPSTLSVERELTCRRPSSTPSTPRGDLPVASSSTAPARPTAVATDAKPPLTPRSGAAPSSTTRKRYVGERRRSDSLSASTHDVASARAEGADAAPVAAHSGGGGGGVDIPIPETSGAASVRNGSFASVASSRASSVGSRSGRLVGLRPHSPRESVPVRVPTAPGADMKTPQASTPVGSSAAREGHVPSPAAANPSDASAAYRVAPERSDVREVGLAQPSSTTSPGRSPRLSEERQRAISQGLQELDQINLDMDQILRSLSRGT